MVFEHLVVVKGAGDLATGVAYRLVRSGFPVVMTELAEPNVVRRTVAFAQAVFDGSTRVEGITAHRVGAAQALGVAWEGDVAVVVDPRADVVPALSPSVVVDAIMAKRNTGTYRTDAPVVIALGPGFFAGVDVHAVVETDRGHRLGRVILEGGAAPDTGIPAPVNGHAADRVLRAPSDGVFTAVCAIGDRVAAGDVLGHVLGDPVVAPFDGCLRGLIHSGLIVHRGMKVGDVDPRATREHCFTISDKALSIGGGALEATLYLLDQISTIGRSASSAAMTTRLAPQRRSSVARS